VLGYSDMVEFFFPPQHVSKCAVFLVGTISSWEPPRQISHEAMKEFSEQHEVEYLECELDHVAVNEIFMSLVDKIINTYTLSGQIRESADIGKGIESESSNKVSPYRLISYILGCL